MYKNDSEYAARRPSDPVHCDCCYAQDGDPSPAKLPVYANISIGYGNTFFSRTLGEKETINGERGFGRNQGNTLTTWFYVAPTRWKGLGVGTGIKGFFATPNNGGNNETYLFNYYHVGVGAKYHLFSKTFNKGLALKSSFGIGQMTKKTKFNATRTYQHQFAIGTTLLTGWVIRFQYSENGQHSTSTLILKPPADAVMSRVLVKISRSKTTMSASTSVLDFNLSDCC